MTLCNCGCGQEVRVDHSIGEEGKSDIVLRVSARPDCPARNLIATIALYLRTEGRFERRVTMTAEERIKFAAELAPELVEALEGLTEFVFGEHHANDPDYYFNDQRDREVKWPANQQLVNKAFELLKTVRRSVSIQPLRTACVDCGNVHCDGGCEK